MIKIVIDYLVSEEHSIGLILTPEEQIKYWLNAAEHDLPAAESLFANNRFDWCLFLGHLMLEKILKALYVQTTKETPPRTHDLLRLAKNIDIAFTDEQITFLSRVNDFNIEARYPDEKFSFSQLCTKEFTETHYNRIKDLFQWLRSRIQLSNQ